MHSTRTTAPRARTHTHTTPHLRRSTRTAARITSIRPEHDHPTQRRDTSAREPTSDFSCFFALQVQTALVRGTPARRRLCVPVSATATTTTTMTHTLTGVGCVAKSRVGDVVKQRQKHDTKELPAAVRSSSSALGDDGDADDVVDAVGVGGAWYTP